MNAVEPPDPEQMLKMLDMEIALKRSKREHDEEQAKQKRAATMLIGLGMLGALVAIAFLLLQSFAPELKEALHNYSESAQGKPGKK